MSFFLVDSPQNYFFHRFLKTSSKYLFFEILIILLIYFLIVWLNQSSYEGTVEVFHHSDGNLSESKQVFSYTIDNKPQSIEWTLDSPSTLQQLKLYFATRWPLFLKLESLQVSNQDEQILTEIHFSEGEGVAWEQIGHTPLEHFMISQESLAKIVEYFPEPSIERALSLLLGKRFLSREEFHQALKQVSQEIDWRKRAVIRAHTLLPVYQLFIDERVSFVSPALQIDSASKITLKFVSSKLTTEQLLSIFLEYWVIFFAVAAVLIALAYSQHTGKPLHLD